MSKDRKFIAKGTTKNKELVAVGDKKDNKRLITFSNEGKAKHLSNSYFYNSEKVCDDYCDLENHLEAVKCEISIDMLT